MPQHLYTSNPAGVSDQAAAFTVVAAVGLQGIRLAQPSICETFLVSGLGLIGLQTGKLLLAKRVCLIITFITGIDNCPNRRNYCICR